jgi:antitoxin component HigA of HigAB toxin-antitoxin module
VANGKRTASERPILVDSDEALDRAVRKIDALLDRGDGLSSEEALELDRLSNAVRRYEQKHLPVAAQAPGELLRFLLDANELSVEELAVATGVAASTLTASWPVKKHLILQGPVRSPNTFVSANPHSSMIGDKRRGPGVHWRRLVHMPQFPDRMPMSLPSTRRPMHDIPWQARQDNECHDNG